MPALAPTGYYSIANYGAVGDGVTDNTTAINNTITYCMTNNLGVFIPQGVFAHSGVLQNNSGGSVTCSVLGANTSSDPTAAGSSVSVLFGTNIASCTLNWAPTVPGTQIAYLRLSCVAGSRQANAASARINVGGSGWVIHDIIIDGAGSAGIVNYGSASYFHYYGNTVYNTNADGFQQYNGASNGLIENNTHVYTGDDCLSNVSESSKGTNNAVTQFIVQNNIVGLNQTANNSTSGRGLSALGADRIYWFNNKIYPYNMSGTGNPLGLVGTKLYGSASTVFTPVISAAPQAGCYIACESNYQALPNTNITLDSNQFLTGCGGYNNHGAIMFYASQTGVSMSNIKIVNNTITSPNTCAIKFGAGGGFASPVQDVLIAFNTFTGAATTTTAATILGAGALPNKVTICGNTFINGANACIYFPNLPATGTASVYIDGNTMTNNNGTNTANGGLVGIPISCAALQFTNNVVSQASNAPSTCLNTTTGAITWGGNSITPSTIGNVPTSPSGGPAAPTLGALNFSITSGQTLTVTASQLLASASGGASPLTVYWCGNPVNGISLPLIGSQRNGGQPSLTAPTPTGTPGYCSISSWAGYANNGSTYTAYPPNWDGQIANGSTYSASQPCINPLVCQTNGSLGFNQVIYTPASTATHGSFQYIIQANGAQVTTGTVNIPIGTQNATNYGVTLGNTAVQSTGQSFAVNLTPTGALTSNLTVAFTMGASGVISGTGVTGSNPYTLTIASTNAASSISFPLTYTPSTATGTETISFVSSGGVTGGVTFSPLAYQTLVSGTTYKQVETVAVAFVAPPTWSSPIVVDTTSGAATGPLIASSPTVGFGWTGGSVWSTNSSANIVTTAAAVVGTSLLTRTGSGAGTSALTVNVQENSLNQQGIMQFVDTQIGTPYLVFRNNSGYGYYAYLSAATSQVRIDYISAAGTTNVYAAPINYTAGNTYTLNVQCYQVASPAVQTNFVVTLTNNTSSTTLLNAAKASDASATALQNPQVSGFALSAQGATQIVRVQYYSDLTVNAATSATGYTVTPPNSGTMSTATSSTPLILSGKIFTTGGGGALTSTLVVSVTDNGAGGTFVPSNGQVSLTTGQGTTGFGYFTYQPSAAGSPVISWTYAGGNASMTGNSSQTETISPAPSPPPPPPPGATGYTVTLATNDYVNSALTGTIALSGGTLLASNLNVAFTSNNGGVFSPNPVVMQSGQSVGSFTYTPINIGAELVAWTYTGGNAGMLGNGSQTETVTTSPPSPPPPPASATGYSVLLAQTGVTNIVQSGTVATTGGEILNSPLNVTFTLSNGGVITPNPVVVVNNAGSAVFTYKPTAPGSENISWAYSGGNTGMTGNSSQIETISNPPPPVPGGLIGAAAAVPNADFAGAQTSEPMADLDQNFSAVTGYLNNPINRSNFALDTGLANGLVANPSPAVVQVGDGLQVNVKVAYANTGTTTLNVNGLGPQPCYANGNLLSGGELTANNITTFAWNASLGGGVGGWALLANTSATSKATAVNSIQSLQAITGTPGQVVFVQGYYTLGDGGEGEFVWNSNPLTTGLSSVLINNGGSGYTNGTYTNVAFTGGSGSGALATVTVAGGAITSVVLTANGTGYISPPQLVLLTLGSGSKAVCVGVPYSNGGTAIVPTSSTTGYWQRTLTNGTYTPLMFGAKGDGTTDDTNAFQMMLWASGVGGKMSVPAKTYFVSYTLIGQNCQQIIGAGTQSAIINRTGDYGDTLYIANAGACKIANLWMQITPYYVSGNTALTNLATSGSHIHLVNAQFAVVEENTLWRMPYNIRLDHCTITTVRKNWLQGVWDSAHAAAQEGIASIYLDVTSGNNEIIAIENNYINGALSTARTLTFTASDGSASTTIAQNIGPLYGVLNHGCEDFVFTNNYIGGQESVGIYCLPAVGSTNLDWRISNNFFDACGNVNGSGIYFGTQANSAYLNGLTISGNVFNGEVASWQAITFSNPNTLSDPTVTNFSITGNTFQAYVGSCIEVNSATGGVISGNSFTGYNALNASPTGVDYTFAAAVYVSPYSAAVLVTGNIVGGAVNTDIPGDYCYNGVVIQNGTSVQANNFANGIGAGGAKIGYTPQVPGILTTAGNYQALEGDQIIIANATNTGAWTFGLPTNPATGRTITLKDGNGSAATHNIQVLGTVDGTTNPTYSTAYFTHTFVFNGTQWNVIV